MDSKYNVKETFKRLIIILVFITLIPLSQASIDCGGKAFNCVNTTHFKICVDFGNGISYTVDDFVIPCPPGTGCNGLNHFECEFMSPTTQPSLLVNSDMTTSKTPDGNSILWENIATNSPSPSLEAEFSEKYLNTEKSLTSVDKDVVFTSKTNETTSSGSTSMYLGTDNNFYSTQNYTQDFTSHPVIEDVPTTEQTNTAQGDTTQTIVLQSTAITETNTDSAAKATFFSHVDNLIEITTTENTLDLVHYTTNRANKAIDKEITTKYQKSVTKANEIFKENDSTIPKLSYEPVITLSPIGDMDISKSITSSDTSPLPEIEQSNFESTSKRSNAQKALDSKAFNGLHFNDMRGEKEKNLNVDSTQTNLNVHNESLIINLLKKNSTTEAFTQEKQQSKNSSEMKTPLTLTAIPYVTTTEIDQVAISTDGSETVLENESEPYVTNGKYLHTLSPFTTESGASYTGFYDNEYSPIYTTEGIQTSRNVVSSPLYAQESNSFTTNSNRYTAAYEELYSTNNENSYQTSTRNENLSTSLDDMKNVNDTNSIHTDYEKQNIKNESTYETSSSVDIKIGIEVESLNNSTESVTVPVLGTNNERENDLAGMATQPLVNGENYISFINDDRKNIGLVTQSNERHIDILGVTEPFPNSNSDILGVTESFSNTNYESFTSETITTSSSNGYTIIIDPVDKISNHGNNDRINQQTDTTAIKFPSVGPTTQVTVIENSNNYETQNAKNKFMYETSPTVVSADMKNEKEVKGMTKSTESVTVPILYTNNERGHGQDAVAIEPLFETENFFTVNGINTNDDRGKEMDERQTNFLGVTEPLLNSNTAIFEVTDRDSNIKYKSYVSETMTTSFSNGDTTTINPVVKFPGFEHNTQVMATTTDADIINKGINLFKEDISTTENTYSIPLNTKTTTDPEFKVKSTVSASKLLVSNKQFNQDIDSKVDKDHVHTTPNSYANSETYLAIKDFTENIQVDTNTVALDKVSTKPEGFAITTEETTIVPQMTLLKVKVTPAIDYTDLYSKTTEQLQEIGKNIQAVSDTTVKANKPELNVSGVEASQDLPSYLVTVPQLEYKSIPKDVGIISTTNANSLVSTLTVKSNDELEDIKQNTDSSLNTIEQIYTNVSLNQSAIAGNLNMLPKVDQNPLANLLLHEKKNESEPVTKTVITLNEQSNKKESRTSLITEVTIRSETNDINNGLNTMKPDDLVLSQVSNLTTGKNIYTSIIQAPSAVKSSDQYLTNTTNSETEDKRPVSIPGLDLLDAQENEYAIDSNDNINASIIGLNAEVVQENPNFVVFTTPDHSKGFVMPTEKTIPILLTSTIKAKQFDNTNEQDLFKIDNSPFSTQESENIDSPENRGVTVSTISSNGPRTSEKSEIQSLAILKETSKPILQVSTRPSTSQNQKNSSGIDNMVTETEKSYDPLFVNKFVLGGLNTENTMSSTITPNAKKARQGKDVSTTVDDYSKTKDFIMPTGTTQQIVITSTVKPTELIQNQGLPVRNLDIETQYHSGSYTDNPLLTTYENSQVSTETMATTMSLNPKVTKERPYADTSILTADSKITNSTMQKDTTKPLLVTSTTKPHVTLQHIISNEKNKVAQKVTDNKNRHIANSATNILAENNTNKLPTNKDHKNPLQEFDCILSGRGRFSDKKDCRKFYICIGQHVPIIGYCPNNTVFSTIKKQCTKNLSHCIRENEFKCTTSGRFSDYLKENVYYICVKNGSHFMRYTFKCQNGFHLEKSKVKCLKNVEFSDVSQSSSSDDVSDKNSRQSSQQGHSHEDTQSNKSTEIKEKRFQCTEEGKFPHPSSCRKYYICSKTKKSELRRKRKKCDKDELFDKDKKKCVDAESYECHQ